MDKYICVVADYLHRRFTIEGKIASVPRTADALKELVDLREHFSERGIATAELDAQLQQSSAQIGRYLNELLRQQGRILVNDRLLSAGDRKRIEAIERVEPLLIPVSSDRPADADSSGSNF